MASSTTTTFYKQATCPASETLLSYYAYGLPAEDRRRVTAHLSACDFCNAELQMFTEHPPCEESEMTLEETTMPLSLRCLAEVLLVGNTLDAATTFFTNTIYDKARLTLTDA